MRRSFATALFLALVLPIIILEQDALGAVKSGATCSRQGVTQFVGTLKFTCIKSGKKLIWDKGTLVKKAIPSPNSSPTASSAPVPKQSPTASAPPSSKYMAGDSCFTIGKQEVNASGYLECREVADKQKKYFQISLTPNTPPLNISPEKLDVCRLQHLSTTDRSEGPSITYPIPSGKQYAKIPRVGEINALIIPIDFPDSPGSDSPSKIYDDLISKVNAWMKWYSQGKSYYKFQTYNKWIRAPKNTSEYVAADSFSALPPDYATNYKVGRKINAMDIASEYLDLAKDHYNYTNMHNVFFIYPRDVKNIWAGIWKLGINDPVRGWKTTDDPRLINVWVTATAGRDAYFNFPVWAFFLHENLHNQGLQGHAPNQGSNFGIMTNQYGLSLVLNSWDTLIIDWQYENQFYCVQRENLKPTTLTLSPLEREEIGTKAIMIKLSNSQALVIESRRRDKWSSGYNGFPGLPVGFYGLIVYKVDTTAKPLYGVEEPDGPDWKDSSTAYAYLIRNLNVDHGYINGAPQSGRIDLNFVMYEGESLTTNGIKISLVKSGDHDEVKIEKEN